MHKTRLELQDRLEMLLGSRSVYFQPPQSVMMQYPAIVYKRQTIDNLHADDSVYLQKDAYQLTLIDKNPDSELYRKLSVLPYCRFDRHYTADNLNHWIFTLFY